MRKEIMGKWKYPNKELPEVNTEVILRIKHKDCVIYYYHECANFLKDKEYVFVTGVLRNYHKSKKFINGTDRVEKWSYIDDPEMIIKNCMSNKINH